jgi:hypothetical protein
MKQHFHLNFKGGEQAREPAPHRPHNDEPSCAHLYSIVKERSLPSLPDEVGCIPRGIPLQEPNKLPDLHLEAPTVGDLLDIPL